jgi:ABC-2 type transport system permease protein
MNLQIKTYFKNLKTVLGLSFSLAKANFKLRNEGSYLGILWYLLEPLCFFLIILLIGGAINQNPVEHYPLYLFLGLIMFNFFANTTSVALKSISSNGGLIKSIKVNYESFVVSGVFQFVFSHAVEMFIFFLFMIFFKVNFLLIVFYIPIFFLFLLFVLGISFALATIEVYISDLSNIWSVACRLLWFLTPIFYVMPSNNLFQKISYINPMFHFINISREIIIYGTFPNFYTLLLMIFFSVLSLVLGIIIFRKYKSKFAQVL